MKFITGTTITVLCAVQVAFVSLMLYRAELRQQAPLPVVSVKPLKLHDGYEGIAVSVAFEAKADTATLSVEISPGFDNDWIVTDCVCIDGLTDVPIQFLDLHPDRDRPQKYELPTTIRHVNQGNGDVFRHGVEVDATCLSENHSYQAIFVLRPRRFDVPAEFGMQRVLNGGAMKARM